MKRTILRSLPLLYSIALLGCPSWLRAQDLPLGATPRGVIVAFLNETASAVDSINRMAFRPRLVGDIGRMDPRAFKGMLPLGASFRVDTIPALPSGPDRQRVLAYTSVDIDGVRENWYFYCTGDTIWRLEAMRRFPTALERTQIRQSLATLDTSKAKYRSVYSEFQRLLLPDDSLRLILRRSRGDAEKLLGQLCKAHTWQGFEVRDVDFSTLEEYRELDDDVDTTDLVFYTADRGAIERLKRTMGLRRIERDARYPDLVFLVAGVLDRSSYGYIYAPNGAALPELSPDEFFMMKQAAEGWWLYKRVR